MQQYNYLGVKKRDLILLIHFQSLFDSKPFIFSELTQIQIDLTVDWFVVAEIYIELTIVSWKHSNRAPCSGEAIEFLDGGIEV